MLGPQNPAQAGELPANLTVNNNQPLAVAADKNEGTLALTVGPQTRRDRRRLLAELAMSAGLGWLLHRSARLARWDR